MWVEAKNQKPIICGFKIISTIFQIRITNGNQASLRNIFFSTSIWKYIQVCRFHLNLSIQFTSGHNNSTLHVYPYLLTKDKHLFFMKSKNLNFVRRNGTNTTYNPFFVGIANNIKHICTNKTDKIIQWELICISHDASFILLVSVCFICYGLLTTSCFNALSCQYEK